MSNMSNMNNVVDNVMNVANTAREYFNNTLKNRNRLIQYGYIIISFLLFLVLRRYFIKLNKLNNNDDKMKSISKNNFECCSNIVYFDPNSSNNNHYLVDYFILSSYNSCCGGGMQDDYVALNPLITTMKSGARFLDFEIYSKDGLPVIAASPELSNTTNNGWKGTFNHLGFNEVMKTIKNINRGANKGPLFLNFRIKTNSDNIYSHMANSINDLFKDKLLDYTFTKAGENAKYPNKLLRTKLKKLNDRIIIFCNDPNKNYIDTGFYSLINLITNQSALVSDNETMFKGYDKATVDSSKENLYVVKPDDSKINPMFPIYWEKGCQFVCMNFGTIDSHLLSALKIYNDNGSAFKLKPTNMRYIPVFPKQPKPNKFTESDFSVSDQMDQGTRDLLDSFKKN